MKKISNISRITIIVSALIMIIAFFVPLWRILMWAPQYPEWLTMKIWINNITGDIKIINGLNHYIGMKLIEPVMFPEFGYMSYLLGSLIGVGVVAGLLGRRWAVWSYLALIISAGIAALVDFYLWGYDYGHNLNPEAAIQVPGMTYQPPLIGTKQLLNFTAFSGPDIGSWILIVSGLLVAFVIIYEWRKKSDN